MRFVAEIFHRLVIEQAIDGLGMGLGILLIHTAAKFEPPLRHRKRECDKRGNSDKSDGGIFHAIEPPQYAANHNDFDQGGENVEQHEGEQKLNALHATFNSTRQSTGAPFQVKAQRQSVQMIENTKRYRADGTLGDFGEYSIPQFAKCHRRDTQNAISNQDSDRYHNKGCLIGP